MSRMMIAAAKEQGEGRVNLSGWARNLRIHKGLIFIDLRDLSGQMQLVVLESAAAFLEASKLTLESVISVSGTLQEKPAKKGDTSGLKDYEVLVDSLEILSLANESLPIPVLTKADNEAETDLRFDYRWLDLRQEEKQLIFKTWSKLEEGFREEFSRLGFMQIYTPCLMSTASETGSEVFEVKYFDRKAYLSQSPQFYKQMAIASGLEKVFTFGPVFRAEKSFTTRHVTEFTGWDFEFAFLDSHQDIMDVEEKLLVSGFKKLKTELNLDIEVPAQPFPRITLADVKVKLKATGVTSEKEGDLSPEEEREICRLIKEETGHDFIFVTDYPAETRAFYHMRYPDTNITKSFDLLYRGVEVTTGAQREHRVDILEKQALEKGMNLEELKDYINFFRFGCPPHGGVGIGPARLIMKILNLDSVKEACFLPRDVRRLLP
ncbi:MAG: aspartate--tRNA(Asn) ligase [Candidatus Falkowbacteria bacterium]